MTTEARRLQTLLLEYLSDWRTRLQIWAISGALEVAASQALELVSASSSLRDLSSRLEKGDWSDLPRVELLESSGMGGAIGAWASSTQTIYLNSDWLAEASNSRVLEVLTEVFGHYLDSRLNKTDARGDEGEYFIRILDGEHLTANEIKTIRSEEDLVTLRLHSGQVIKAEAANVIGSEANGILNGTSFADIIRGSGGNEAIYGLEGNDVIDGGNGDDTLSGGDGTDIAIYSGNSPDYAITQVNYNTFRVKDIRSGSPDGVDTLNGIEKLKFNDGIQDLLIIGLNVVGDGTSELINGGFLMDYIDGAGGDDIINGKIGSDYLVGGVGADSMPGGAGDDTYMVDNIGDVVTELVKNGTDTVRSSIAYTLGANLENLILIGTSKINGTGNSDNNAIIGNLSDNTIDGGTGADTMTGGRGDDTYVVDNIGDVVTELANEGTDTVKTSITYTYTLGANLENLTLTGSSKINGTGNSVNNIITGNSVDNIIDGKTGADTMTGGSGDDTYVVDDIGDLVAELVNEGTDTVKSSITYTLGTNLENLILTGTRIITRIDNNRIGINGIGNSANNTIVGDAFDNTIDGLTGADTMIGGAGNDTYIVDNIGDVTTEKAGKGIDIVRSSITYTLGANLENLTLTGTSKINGMGNNANNIITGNSVDNIIDGGTGADLMTGGGGNDTYMIDSIGDAVTELLNEGVDTIKSSITYTLGANLENLILTDVVDNIGDVVKELANEATDAIKTSIADAFVLYLKDLPLTIAGNINGTGNSTNNKIAGNSAANILTGGAGADVQTGSGGADTFRYLAMSDSSLTFLDQITDLSIGTDILDGPTAVTAENTKELGTVKTFDQAGIAAVLNEAVFGPNQAATFSYDLGIGIKTFIALNDLTAGFSSTSDSLIEITGYTGLLTDLYVV